MIYAVEIGDRKFIKIGYSGQEELQMRIAQLQTGCPYEIRAILFIEGSLRQEQTLHASLRTAFARIRIPMPPNEWYPGKAPMMGSFVKQLKYGFDVGLGFLERYNPAIKQPGQKSDDVYMPNMRWPSLK